MPRSWIVHSGRVAHRLLKANVTYDLDAACPLITSEVAAFFKLFSNSFGCLGVFLSFNLRCCLHCIPRALIAQLVASPPPPLKVANITKNQPLPIMSNRGCKTATATADKAQRAMLLEAAAVLGLAGKMSTNRTLNVCLLETCAEYGQNKL